jgi:putative NIF3 family GTP cyclohydrolase 1 type 2
MTATPATREPETLAVPDPKTGELVELKTATWSTLALLHGNLDEHREQVAAAADLVSREMVARLDKRGSWTHRVSHGDQCFEITAPSPDAGSEEIVVDVLEAELRALLAADRIEAEAATAALERKLTLTLSVPLEADIEAIAKAVREAREIVLAGVQVVPLKVEPVRSAKKAGVKAIAKIPGCKAAMERAVRKVPGGARRAKVKRID